MRLAVLCSRIRVEEKLLLQELERRRVPFERLDDAGLVLGPDPVQVACDVVFDRSISFGRSLYALRTLEGAGVRCVNRAEVVATCGDKQLTTVALRRAGVPVPRSAMAFTPEGALAALDVLGYPAVIKPVVGSWGRLVARINDRDAAEAVLEDRALLGSWQHHVFYLQELVEKPGRDIRAFVVGDEPICAVYRHSSHWITNTARGATTSCCPVAGAVGDAALQAARAVGGGIVAVDLVEAPDGRLLVIEVNHTTEFRNSIGPTGVDIPGRIVDHVLDVAEGRVP